MSRAACAAISDPTDGATSGSRPPSPGQAGEGGRERDRYVRCDQYSSASRTAGTPPGPGAADAAASPILPFAAITDRKAIPQIEKATAKAIRQTVRLRMVLFLRCVN